MTRSDKLLETARNNPAGLRFDDFQTLLHRLSWTLDRQEGSHLIWYSPQGNRIKMLFKINQLTSIVFRYF